MLKSTDQFMGFDGFVWFQGVVESRADPLFLGRLQVRILGIHTEDKSKIPTKDLPWAYPVMPVTSASMNGIGQTPIGAVEGTWVVGFFRDGESCQEPMILGTFGGIPQSEPKSDQGFNDPNGFYPVSDYLKEPDTNRLARNENIDNTVVAEKKKNLQTGISVALNADDAWDEPTPLYNTTYPYNHVYETESGHIKEYDDTPNNERIHEYHRMGTYYEIGPDGSKVTKVVNDNYSIVMGGDYAYVDGVCNLTVNGDVNVSCNKDANIEINNDANITIKNNATVSVDGDTYLDLTGDMTCNVGGDVALTSASDGKGIDIYTYGAGDVSIQALGEGNATVAGTNVTVNSKLSTVVNSGGFLTVTAKTGMILKTDGMLQLQGSVVQIAAGSGGLDITAGAAGIGMSTVSGISLMTPKVLRLAKLTFDLI